MGESRRARARATFLFALLVAAMLAGCGGPDQLTKAQFIRQGNEICVSGIKEREASLAAVVKEAEGEPGPTEAVEGALSPIKEMVDELNGLGVPKGDEKEVEAIIAGFEEGIEAIEANPKQALGGASFQAADEAATAYGLNECAI